MIPRNYVDLARDLGAWAIWGCVPGNPTIDLSGNNRALTLTGSRQSGGRLATSGIPGVRFGSASYGSFAATTGGTTVSMMVWCRHQGQGGALIANGNSTYTFPIGIGTGASGFGAGNDFRGVNTNVAWHTGFATLAQGDYCLGVTVSGTAVRAFVNGKMVNTATRTSGTATGTPSYFSAWSGAADPFVGTIGGGLIFTGVLTDEQMRQLYEAGLRDGGLLGAA